LVLTKRQGQHFPFAAPDVLGDNPKHVASKSPPTGDRLAADGRILAGLPGINEITTG
jgi:hypothetical protein